MAQRLDAYFTPLADAGDFSGAIRVRFADGSILTRHYGYADIASQAPHGAGTRYGLGSVTKSVTAVTLLGLASEGVVDLDAPLANHFPAFAGRSQATIRDVLLHRAGLPRDFPADHDPVATPASAWLVSSSATCCCSPGTSTSSADWTCRRYGRPAFKPGPPLAG